MVITLPSHPHQRVEVTKKLPKTGGTLQHGPFGTNKEFKVTIEEQLERYQDLVGLPVRMISTRRAVKIEELSLSTECGIYIFCDIISKKFAKYQNFEKCDKIYGIDVSGVRYLESIDIRMGSIAVDDQSPVFKT